MAVIRRDPRQHVFDVDALSRPALVAQRDLVAPVLLDLQSVLRGAAHEAVLAEPHGQPAQKTQVGLDRGRCQVLAPPHVDHRLDVAMAEVARVGQGLEAALGLQVAKEAAQEHGALMPCLVRDRLLQRGVLGIEQCQQNFQHAQRRCRAGLLPRQDLARAQTGPLLAADRLVARGTAAHGRALAAASGGERYGRVGHGSLRCHLAAARTGDRSVKWGESDGGHRPRGFRRPDGAWSCRSRSTRPPAVLRLPRVVLIRPAARRPRRNQLGRS